MWQSKYKELHFEPFEVIEGRKLCVAFFGAPPTSWNDEKVSLQLSGDLYANRRCGTWMDTENGICSYYMPEVSLITTRTISQYVKDTLPEMGKAFPVDANPT